MRPASSPRSWTLAHCLHIGVVAEGVESEAQLSVLAAHQCHQAQGFLLGRPHPANELGRFMLAAGANQGELASGQREVMQTDAG